MTKVNSQLLFSDYFDIPEKRIDDFGALNICVEADLPLFIDPFLLFASERADYRSLHAKIVGHLVALKHMALSHPDINRRLFMFPEIKQNWLGVSKWGNKGKGLGPTFADNLVAAFNGFYANFGTESITSSAHIEKLTLVGSGIGRDFISDFTTNLMLEFLLDYTQEFARTHLAPHQVQRFSIRCVFDQDLAMWKPRTFELPYFFRDGDDADFIILTPLDILSKDDAYISHGDLKGRFKTITNAMDNATLRDAVNLYFQRNLPASPKPSDIERSMDLTIAEYPELLDLYIRYKEDRMGEAAPLSKEKVDKLRTELLATLTSLLERVFHNSDFYTTPTRTYESALIRANFLKQVIEDNDGYRVFYKDGKPIASEETIQRIFRLTWFATPFDVNSEVNNGRGPADYKISFGERDSTIVEFKLGSSSSLKKNLLHQTAIYKKASKSISDIKVILCYSKQDIAKVARVLKGIQQEGAENIVVIDATPKLSASKFQSD
jgi:hypothetical protein